MSTKIVLQEAMHKRSLLTIIALLRRSSGADNDCIPSGVTVDKESEILEYLYKSELLKFISLKPVIIVD